MYMRDSVLKKRLRTVRPDVSTRMDIEYFEHHLRAIYKDVVMEPVPKRLIETLRKLKTAEEQED